MNNPQIRYRERADYVAELLEQICEEFWDECAPINDTCVACGSGGDIRSAENGEPMCRACHDRYVNDRVRLQELLAPWHETSNRFLLRE